MGAFPYKGKCKDLVDYESSLPPKCDVPMKKIKDFDRFSDEQKQKLLEHHGKAVQIIEVQ